MTLKQKLLLPVALCGLLVIVYIAVGWVPGEGPAGMRLGIVIVAALGLLLMLATASLAIDAHVRRPLAMLLHAAHGSSEPMADAPDEIGQVGAALRALRTRVDDLERALKLAADERRQMEVTLRSSEERYALAMRTCDDGLWEWNLQTQTFMLSARWKSMLGYDDDELANTRQAWLQCVHPADVASVEAALLQHLEGATPRYEQQLRLLHKDGRYRWVSSIGSAIRHASGRPSRFVALDTDITRVRRIENILQHIVQGTSGKSGDDFFRTLVRHFAAALDVSCAFVTECTGWPPKSVHTLAFWFQDGFRENFEFELAGTPCEAVFSLKRPAFHPQNVGKLFPRDDKFESYYGLPIFNSERQVIGHMAFFDDKEMKEEDILMDSVYSIFTARAAVEIERKAGLDRLTRTDLTATGPAATAR
ncbi:PAS domain S-box-containing protein [Paraburkholderia sp. BL8N3]|jgi:PAS domain S-box-containing protein|nr:PAS domain-containing protein [Paraburkholderia sp. BL8N3]TCK35189.1 PAS domain S-box-containing protein [Paraburkholderia sp. BL8N3]